MQVVLGSLFVEAAVVGVVEIGNRSVQPAGKTKGFRIVRNHQPVATARRIKILAAPPRPPGVLFTVQPPGAGLFSRFQGADFAVIRCVAERRLAA